MDIYLVRHTRVAVDRGICYGQTDVGLADTFSIEAETLLRKFPEEREYLAVYTSPLERCRYLAEKLGKGGEVIDNRIQEMSFGDWEMVPWKDIDRNLFEEWAGDFVNITCPGGESYRDLYERVSGFWDDLLARGHEAAAVVTHAGVIHAILARVTGMDLAKTLLFFFDYGSVSRVSIKGLRTVVQYLNR